MASLVTVNQSPTIFMSAHTWACQGLPFHTAAHDRINTSDVLLCFQLILEAERSLWEGKEASESASSSSPNDGTPDTGASTVAMARMVVTGASMDLGMLRHSASIHISIAGDRASADDLRLMYRCGPPPAELLPGHASACTCCGCLTHGS